MYPNPPFNEPYRRSIEVTGEIATQCKTWTASSTSVANLWPWPHVALGLTSAAIVVAVLFDWAMDLFAPITSSKLTAGAATSLVIIVFSQLLHRHRLRVDALIREARKAREATVGGQKAAAEAMERRHEDNLAKLNGLLTDKRNVLRTIHEVAATTLAAGEQFQARSEQLRTGVTALAAATAATTARLDQIDTDRAAEGEARKALETALVATLAAVVDKAMTDFGCRIAAVEQTTSMSRDDIQMIGNSVREALVRLGTLTRRTSALEGKVGRAGKAANSRGKRVAPTQRNRRTEGRSGMDIPHNGSPVTGMDAEVIRLGRRISRKIQNGDQPDQSG